MVLSDYLDKGGFLTEQFQGGKHLDTFSDRYVCIDGTVQEQDRCVDLVGMEQRTLFYIYITGIPGITVGGGQ